jgi:1-deoxyxylulose-5-phosphate synthase
MPARIGLGCVTFGREIDEVNSFIMMDYAVTHGISFFDTASAYSAGESEKIVGTWLNSRKYVADSVVVATKILPPYDAGSIAAAVDASRYRLGKDQVDLLFLHRWDDSVLTAETLRALDDLVRKGIVQKLGASNFSSAQLEQAVRLQQQLQLRPFSVAQNNHNYAVREYTTVFKHTCEANDIDMITYSPLGAGFLTGKHLNGVQKGSRFDNMPAHQAIYFNEEAQTRLQRLMAVADQTGYSPAQLALAWAFHQPVAMVLAGGRSVKQLDQAIQALSINDDILSKLAD